ncbi:MAG: hypothetical protein R2764_03910 [Bacteroidales bacterium]
MAPMIRTICQETGLRLREIYELFPLGPAHGDLPHCRFAQTRWMCINSFSNEYLPEFSCFSLIVCLVSLIYHLFRLIRYGKPKDYSRQRGNIRSAIRYAYTGQ